MTTTFKPSKYQQALFDFISSGRGNAVVEAVAGSGKTTSILQSLQIIPKNKSICFLAFNRDIAQVLRDRTQEMGCMNVECLTLNALGNRAWGKFKGTPRTNVNGNKLMTMARDYRDELEVSYSNTLTSTAQRAWGIMDTYLFNVVNLVRKAKIAGMVPQDVSGVSGLLADTEDNWVNLITHYDLEFDEDHRDDADCIKAAKVLLRRSVVKQDEIDFDDQFYMPMIYNAPFQKSDYLFIDEAQDVSAIQLEVLTRCCHSTTRVIAVGDPKQAIYGFRGSDVNSLENIGTRFSAVRLPLSISYRCAQAIVAEAKKIVSHIEASPTAAVGEVIRLGENFSFADFRQDDMILCRNTAPLVQLAYSLIAHKIPCLVRGRDIGSGLIKLVEKLGAATIEGLKTKLDAWEVKEKARLTKKDPDADTTSIEDRASTLRAVIENSRVGTTLELLTEIKTMFKVDGGKDEDGKRENILTLSTVHKAKGQEADRVFILNFHLMPSKMAKSEWAQAQEQNLIYVSITRAKKTLVFIDIAKEGANSAQKTGAATDMTTVVPTEATPSAQVSESFVVSQKWSGKVEIFDNKMMTTKWGRTALIKARTQNGQVITWFQEEPLAVGAYQLDGTVKEAREFRGISEMSFTRVKTYELVPA